MNDEKDPVARVANGGPFILMAVCVLGGALMMSMLVTWGEGASVSAQDLKVLRLFVMAAVAMAVLILLVYVGWVLKAIWPRREKKR